MTQKDPAEAARRSRLRADRDLDLLARPELRPVRLLLEYLKPELGLRDQGVRHTIVVLGSTRALDPETARERLEQAERSAGRVPGDARLGEELRAARRAVEQSRYYAIAREFGRIVGRAGEGPGDNRLLIVTGGGPGVMEAANRGAKDVGAASVGLNIQLPVEQAANPYLTPGLQFEFRYFALRKLHFMQRARALVAFPGGYGTFDELFETLCLMQTGKRVALPVVLVGEEFWRRALDFDFLVERGVLLRDELALFAFAESAPEIWEAIQGWYAERKRSVFEEPTVENGGEDPA
jgi:uncharacterized protein (TIGR00730 family)